MGVVSLTWLIVGLFLFRGTADYRVAALAAFIASIVAFGIALLQKLY